MTRLTVDILLPDTLAEQAREAGLLEPAAIQDMLRQALLAKRAQEAMVDDLLAIGRQYRALPMLDERPADDVLGYDERGLPR